MRDKYPFKCKLGDYEIWMQTARNFLRYNSSPKVTDWSDRPVPPLVDEWFKQVSIKSWIHESIDQQYYYSFEFEEEAVLFKLRWY